MTETAIQQTEAGPKETNTDHPLITIGLPVRNGGQSLRKALNSLLNQTYQNIEIIISDNCSDDKTEEICKTFVKSNGKIRYYRQKKALKAVDNFRVVYELGNGEFFMWAAHDDLRSQDYLETLLALLSGHEDSVLAYTSNVIYFNEKK